MPEKLRPILPDIKETAIIEIIICSASKNGMSLLAIPYAAQISNLILLWDI